MCDLADASRSSDSLLLRLAQDGDVRELDVRLFDARLSVTSVVIAAHNEAAVIARCLAALLGQVDSPPLDITVVVNGSHDDTAAIARRLGVRVIEIPEANKALALNCGDAAASGFPRCYLDADIELPAHAMAAIGAVIDHDSSIFAAVPGRRVDLSRSPAPVRAYFEINTRLPAFESGLFGRGIIALSERGRARFAAFPNMVADDLFLDSQFSPREKARVESVEVTVAAPRRTVDLIRRLIRVRRGNAQLRSAARAGDLDLTVRRADRLAWLRTVVLPNPQLAPAAVAYVVITGIAAALAKMKPSGDAAWGRDESTRSRVSTDQRSR